MKSTLYSAAILLFLVIYAAMPAGAENLGKQPDVFVSIPPQKYFVKQIAGDRANIRVMVEPGSHPATYEPAPSQMRAVSKCDLYFAIGVPFEKAWLKKFKSVNPEMNIVRTDAWIEKQPVDRGRGKPDSGADHGSRDPHIWLSPPLVMIQARHILTALISADPENMEFYESGYRKFIAELAELDEKLRGLFPPGGKKPEFLVFHPAWGYFADAYGLKQTAVEAEGKSPKPAEIRRIVGHAEKKQIKLLLVQPQISTRTADMIAREIGGKTITADPLAENWAKNLMEVAAGISKAAR
ncbi:MAG: zinc ABC transporter substrate-binding protein [Desulfobacteraceae bacterium]|nr:zinc ABC transporter substrate-binding protein [Desulfobacteraceae bacterium]